MFEKNVFSFFRALNKKACLFTFFLFVKKSQRYFHISFSVGSFLENRHLFSNVDIIQSSDNKIKLKKKCS